MTTINKISSFFNFSDFPLILFYELATDYSVDSSFALSMWIWETGYGTSDLWIKHNNPAGITCNNGYCSYNNQKEGLEAMFKLIRFYIDEYKRNTVILVRNLWSESEDAQSIYKIMLDIQKR